MIAKLIKQCIIFSRKISVLCAKVQSSLVPPPFLDRAPSLLLLWRRLWVCTSVLPPHRGGAVPSPMGMGWNGRTDLPRRSTKRLPPLSWTVFSLGCPLTGHNWAAPLLIDRTPFQRLLILALLLISDNVHPNPGPICNNPRPRYLAASVTLAWAETPFSVLLASSGFSSQDPYCSSLTRADFRTICATGTAVGWHFPACCPQSQTGPPTQTNSLVTMPASLPKGFPHSHLAFINRVPLKAPTSYPCSLCSHEVGKDSLKCSTCSNWVHFSCSSLTQSNFRKICAAGSTLNWNCPACLNGDLASPTHEQASPTPSLQLHPLSHPPQQHSQM